MAPRLCRRGIQGAEACGVWGRFGRQRSGRLLDGILRNSCQITVEESPRGNPNNEAFSYFHIFYFPMAWGMIALQAQEFPIYLCCCPRAPKPPFAVVQRRLELGVIGGLESKLESINRS